MRICGQTVVSSSCSGSRFRSCRRRWPAPWIGELAAAAAEAGALGSLPCAMLDADQVREQMGKIRAAHAQPINLNFFCHAPPVLNNAREARWRERLAPYYRELGIDPAAPVPSSNRTRVRRGDVRGGGGDQARGRELPFRPAGRRRCCERVKAAGCWSSARPPPLPKRAGSRSTASTPSSPRATRPAAIAACS